ncbi:MAG TPA: NUDIX hydrolase [Bryobacteraceae bacterium]|nr:NUDIX hydrolase [Bryobacteraceae bacterium]
MNNPWRTLASRVVYSNAWIRVREDQVIRPDGAQGVYGVVEIRPSVGIVAINERDEMVLVGQWRYPHGKLTWEIPRGGSHEGETEMLAVARRELREETGVEAQCWESLGATDVNNGVTTDTEHLFLATGLTLHAPRHDPEEQIAIRWLAFETALEMTMRGEFPECCTALAILKLGLMRRRNP